MKNSKLQTRKFGLQGNVGANDRSIFVAIRDAKPRGRKTDILHFQSRIVMDLI